MAHHSEASLKALWKKGTDFLHCRYAILGGAMSWVSNHQLVAALCQAGGFGVLAGGSLSPCDLEKEIHATQALTSQSFGVNLICFHPKIHDLIDVCLEKKVSHVFLGGGIPSDGLIDKLKQGGVKVIGFCPSLLIGQRLIKKGVDALVIEGHEAGGHVGPVTTSVLAQEILPELKDKVPIFVAGGIGHGSAMAQYLRMGALGCQLGTRFVCAQESPAHEDFKKAFIRAHSRDAVVTVQLDKRFPVIPVRALSNKGQEEFLTVQKEMIAAYDAQTLTLEEAQMRIELFWSGALRRAVLDGDVVHGSVMAGQSVGMVKSIEPCQAILARLVQECMDSLS